MNNRKFPFLAAILGIAIGVAGVLVFQAIQGNRRRIRVEFEDWRKLNLVLQTIDDNYVDSVDRAKVTEAAINGALASLDPHSVYLAPRELQESEVDLAGNFEGIGIQFNVPNDTAVVIDVIKGGPSEKAGLMPGDRIVKVDTTVIAGVKFHQDSMVRRLKGPAGTKVKVLVRREGTEIPFDITRGKIPAYSVDAHFMINDTLGYVRLSKFSRTTSKEVEDALEDLDKSGMKRLILDLRNNAGGYLDQALRLGNLFLRRGCPIVYMQGRCRGREDFDSDGSGKYTDLPLSLIIDENTASSSEIFAGAIQDNGRGKIIGRRSFGKGLVQEPVYFTDGSGIRLTIARFYTPSGRCIQKAYDADYIYEIYNRYNKGEMVDADSMKVENGGIVPDVFVPIDTTRVGSFYNSCARKATAMRFASDYFDRHKNELLSIDNFDTLVRYLDSANLEKRFLEFALDKDMLMPGIDEWALEKPYMMTQVRALVGRYCKLGDNAYYHLYLPVDKAVAAAIGQ